MRCQKSFTPQARQCKIRLVGGSRGACASCQRGEVGRKALPLDLQIDTSREFPAPRAFRFSLRRLFMFVFACGIVCFVLFRLLPTIASPKHSAMMAHCNNNLKQIGLALLNYRDIYGCFPPPFIRDENGRPMHSWRRLILDQLDSHPPGIVWPIDMDEPWNSARNLAAARQFVPPCYYCPAERYFGSASQRPPANGMTSYVMIVGEDSSEGSGRCVSRDEMSGQAKPTVIVAEIADSDILWTEPRDLNTREMSFRVNDKSKPGISSHHMLGAWILFADGHTEFVSDKADPATLKAVLMQADTDRAGSASGD